MSNWLLEAEDEEEEQNNTVQNVPASTIMQPTTTNNNRNWLLEAEAEDEEEVEETVTTPVDINYPNENVPLGIEPPNPNLVDQTILAIQNLQCLPLKKYLQEIFVED